MVPQNYFYIQRKYDYFSTDFLEMIRDFLPLKETSFLRTSLQTNADVYYSELPSGIPSQQIDTPPLFKTSFLYGPSTFYYACESTKHYRVISIYSIDRFV